MHEGRNRNNIHYVENMKWFYVRYVHHRTRSFQMDARQESFIPYHSLAKKLFIGSRIMYTGVSKID